MPRSSLLRGCFFFRSWLPKRRKCFFNGGPVPFRSVIKRSPWWHQTEPSNWSRGTRFAVVSVRNNHEKRTKNRFAKTWIHQAVGLYLCRVSKSKENVIWRGALLVRPISASKNGNVTSSEANQSVLFRYRLSCRPFFGFRFSFSQSAFQSTEMWRHRRPIKFFLLVSVFIAARFLIFASRQVNHRFGRRKCDVIVSQSGSFLSFPSSSPPFVRPVIVSEDGNVTSSSANQVHSFCFLFHFFPFAFPSPPTPRTRYDVYFFRCSASFTCRTVEVGPTYAPAPKDDREESR